MARRQQRGKPSRLPLGHGIDPERVYEFGELCRQLGIPPESQRRTLKFCEGMAPSADFFRLPPEAGGRAFARVGLIVDLLRGLYRRARR
jgi:hypothetical protein